MMTMIKAAKLNVRIEPDIKTQGEAVLATLGLSVSEAVNLFYRQIIMHQGLPFEVKIPNNETIAAMEELKDSAKRKHLTTFSSVEDMLADLKP